MTSNNAKSDKEKLDEIIGVIEQKDYLLTKDYFELEAELEEYFQTCESIISNKNSSYLNEANYAAGLIKNLLGEVDDAIMFFNRINDGNKSSESVSLYEKSLYRLFLIAGYSYLGNETSTIMDFDLIIRLFNEIDATIKVTDKIDDKFSEILFMMALLVDKKNEDNNYNNYEDYLIRIIKGSSESFKKEANHYLAIKAIDKICDIAINSSDNKCNDEFYCKTKDYINNLEENTQIIFNKILSFTHINPLVAKYLINIYIFIDNIKNKLRVIKPTYLKIYLFHETKVAHYTSPLIAYKLLNDGGSNIRLNTINYVNDPKEGMVLKEYLSLSTENITNNKYIGTFISCFTFNHDSLNQFRLYGKNNGIEASGVSMIFNINFFNNCLCYSDNSILSNSNSNKYLREKTRLYRCIYIDPDCNYIYLSRRDEVTFYKEYLNKLKKYGVGIDEINKYLDELENKGIYTDGIRKNIDKLNKNKISVHDLDSNVDILKHKELYEIILKVIGEKKIDKLWKDYNNSISDLERTIKDHLFKIIIIINLIKNNFEQLNNQQINIVNNIIADELLPLQYLVKHAAFKEEQECRMIQIIEKTNKKIEKDFDNKLIYINYPHKIKHYLDKIYFSPGAKDYRDFFISEDFPESKLKISLNPFRNK